VRVAPIEGGSVRSPRLAGFARPSRAPAAVHPRPLTALRILSSVLGRENAVARAQAVTNAFARKERSRSSATRRVLATDASFGADLANARFRDSAAPILTLGINGKEA